MTPGPRRSGRAGSVLRALAGNRPLTRIAGAYAMFILSEYSVWIAMLVYAYGNGGAVLAGWVAVAQLVPAAVLAPVVAGLANRWSPSRLLAAGYALQTVGMAATAGAVALDRPVLAYAAAIVASTAVTTTRPAQATLVPALAATPEELTAANVALNWIEAVSIMVSGLLVGLLVAVSDVAAVFAVGAVLGVIAVLLVRRLARGTATAETTGSLPSAGSPAASGPGPRRSLREAVGRSRALVALLGAQAVVVGALDVLFVVLAVDVLGRSQEWAGYLNSAYGAGAVASGSAAALLVGRRLGLPVLGSTLVLSAVLATLAAGPGLAVTLVAVAVVGASRGLLDVSARTLLQRTAPAQEVTRVFGVVEGLTMAGLAAGSLLVPALTTWGGSVAAILGVAAVLPVAALFAGRGLFQLDAAARVPIVEIALLRSLPLFAELPPPAVEGLAAAVTRLDLAAGEVLLREGDPGDMYYAIAAGTLEVHQSGRLLRRCGRGEGVGEIALLRGVTRTATVTAMTDVTVYALSRGDFLGAVTAHAATLDRAGAVAAARLADDARAAVVPPRASSSRARR